MDDDVEGLPWAVAVLDDLASGLPLPAMLLDAAGRPLWMNAEAEERLRPDGGRVELDWVGEEPVVTGGRPRWLLPDERLVVTSVGTPASPRALVCWSSALRDDVPVPPCPSSLGLSRREVEVATYAARGFTVLNIAARLGVAESTVKTHLKRIYKKLDVCSRVELARKLSGGG